MVAIASIASSQTPPMPLKQVSFDPLVINNVEVKGPTYPIDEQKLRAELSQQYNSWIVRSATKKGLAVEIKATGDQNAKTEDFVLRAIFNIPLTHEADKSHWDNHYRRGKFMDYSFSLLSSNGTLVAKVDGNLVWGDGEWSHWMGRAGHRDNGHDDIMKGYVRKAVDRGVAALVDTLKSKK